MCEWQLHPSSTVCGPPNYNILYNSSPLDCEPSLLYYPCVCLFLCFINGNGIRVLESTRQRTWQKKKKNAMCPVLRMYMHA
jgi:hypothetical protein